MLVSKRSSPKYCFTLVLQLNELKSGLFGFFLIFMLCHQWSKPRIQIYDP